MSKNVDEIWAKLKAASAPGGPRKKSALPAVPAIATSTTAQTSGSQSIMEDAAALSAVAPQGKLAPVGGQSGEAARVLAPLQRDVNSLTDSDRSVRKRAVVNLYNALIQSSQAPAAEVLQAALQGPLLQRLVLLLSDPMEKCREIALLLLSDAASRVPDFSTMLPNVLNALKKRMGVGLTSPVEPSEELRLAMLRFVGTQLVHTAHRCRAPAYVDDIAAVLFRGLDDPFHEARKAACTGVENLAATGLSEALAKHAPMLIDPLLACFHHTHSRVRSSAVAALHALVLASPVEHEALMSKVAPAMKLLTTDRAASLRQAAVDAVAAWLGAAVRDAKAEARAPPRRTPPHYFPILLPVLLLGLTDESPEISTHTLARLAAVGDAYVSTADAADHTDSPNQLDSPRCAMETSPVAAQPSDAEISKAPDKVAQACVPAVDGVAAAGAAQLPHPFNGQRAPENARAMVQHQLSALLPPVVREMREWTVALRSSASRSLCSVAVLTEASLLPHLPMLLPALCAAVGDEDQSVALRIINTAHVIGAFCEPQHWLPVMLDALAGAKDAVARTTNSLVVLAALAHAASRAGHHLPPDLLSALATWLSSEDVRALDHAPLQRQLVMVVANVVDLAGPAVAPVAERLFHVLLHVQGNAKLDRYTLDNVAEAQDKLAQACGVSGAAELAAQYAAELLIGMLQRSEHWTSSHPDLPAFVQLLRMCPGVTLVALGQPLCLALGTITKDPERDDMLRMALLRAVDGVLEADERGGKLCAEYGIALLLMVVLPPLVWRAGKAAAAVRFDALRCLCTMLGKGRVTGPQLDVLLTPDAQLVPLIVQSMDEDWYVDTRLAGCYAMTKLLRLAGARLTDEMRRSVYPELNKRMDDSSNDVRIATAGAIVAFAEDAMSATYCDTNSGYFISALLIHLDDSNIEVQNAVFEALQALARKKGLVMRAEVQKVYTDFRSKHLLDQVLAAC